MLDWCGLRLGFFDDNRGDGRFLVGDNKDTGEAAESVGVILSGVLEFGAEVFVIIVGGFELEACGVVDVHGFCGGDVDEVVIVDGHERRSVCDQGADAFHSVESALTFGFVADDKLGLDEDSAASAEDFFAVLGIYEDGLVRVFCENIATLYPLHTLIGRGSNIGIERGVVVRGGELAVGGDGVEALVAGGALEDKQKGLTPVKRGEGAEI